MLCVAVDNVTRWRRHCQQQTVGNFSCVKHRTDVPVPGTDHVEPLPKPWQPINTNWKLEGKRALRWCKSVLRMTEVVVTTGAVRNAKLRSNSHHQPTFYRSDALPVAQPTVSEHLRKKYHIPWTCSTQADVGVFQPCLWPIKAPGYLGGVSKHHLSDAHISVYKQWTNAYTSELTVKLSFWLKQNWPHMARWVHVKCFKSITRFDNIDNSLGINVLRQCYNSLTSTMQHPLQHRRNIMKCLATLSAINTHSFPQWCNVVIFLAHFHLTFPQTRTTVSEKYLTFYSTCNVSSENQSLQCATDNLTHNNQEKTYNLRQMKQKCSERCNHCALTVVRRSQKISPRRRPIPGGARRPKFN